MKYLLVLALVSALLLFGCTSSNAPTPPATPPTGGDLPPAPPSNVPPAPGNTVTPPVPPSQGNLAITASQLLAHNKESDCWVGYKGNVYDITAYIPKHRNYQALIVPLCGTANDFEQLFTTKHGLSKVNILEAQPLMGAYAG